MAVVATTLYSWADTNQITHYVLGSEVVDRGPWSSSITYAVGDVVQIGADQYYAIAPNTDMPPTGVLDENWSAFVVVEEFSVVVNAGSDYYARTLAQLALETAWTGTAIGSAAYDLAVTGTNMVIAETGSRITAINDVYVYIGSVAGSFAFDISVEQGTRAQEDQNLQNQIIAETGSRIAADAAIVSFVFGSIAVDLAAETGSRIAADGSLQTQIIDETGSRIAADAALVAFVFGSIAVDLAAETLSRIAGDQQIISIVNTGTNTANSAWALAQLGTISPPLSTLPDVNIPAPTAQQVLAFDGSRWIASDPPSTIGFGGFTFFLDDNPSGTLTYDKLTDFPTGGTEAIESVVVTTGSGQTVFMNHLSEFLNRTRIDAGVWEFNTYATVDTGSASVGIELLVRSINGSETSLFQVNTPYFSDTTPVNVTVLTSQGSYPLVLTDKLLARYSGTTTNTFPVTLSVYHQGTAHDSHFHSPLILSHNDLDGLQGGTTGQFYHVTLDQNNALVGDIGVPSATNRYVTQQGLGALASTTDFEVGTINANVITEQGTRSQQDQFLYNLIITTSGTAFGSFTDLSGSLAAERLSRIAADSQIIVIASIGTNTGSTAYSTAQSAYYTAQSGSNTANDAYRIACIGTNIGSISYSIANSAYSISISGSTTANNAWTLAQQLSAILGLSLSGTLFLYTADVLYGKPDTRFTIINGVVAGLSPSTWPWEDFEFYGTTTGTTPISEPMYRGSAWDSYGTIFTNNLDVGLTGTDSMNLYATGTINSSTLNSGTGWASSGSSYGDAYWFRFLGTDTFESYGTGTLSGGEMTGGGGWIGAAIVYAGSNRP